MSLPKEDLLFNQYFYCKRLDIASLGIPTFQRRTY